MPKQITIENMRTMAQTKGGKCLSSSFVNMQTKLRWECQYGHIWETTPATVRNGAWCRKCYDLNRCLTIEQMKRIAEARGGECLSEEYVNNETKLTWQCSQKHTWEATPAAVKRGSWCPKCFIYKSEEICRVILEHIFKTPFPKSKPKWLLNSSGQRMELDGYCQQLKIAFEYHGIQHYEFRTRYHKNHDCFYNSRNRDIEKKNICDKFGIELIEIPYFKDNLKPAELIEHVINCLAKRNINVPPFDRSVDFGKIFQKGYYQLLIDIANSKHGKLLSKAYTGILNKHLFECEKGHKWWTVASNIINVGSWCPVCAKERAIQAAKKTALTIDEMKILAQNNKGGCLSTEYTNSKTKLKWRCEFGHQWEASPMHIKNGTWCPFCDKQKNLERLKKRLFALDEIHNLAKAKGGKCLSSEYKISGAKLRWQCHHGHTWEASPVSVKSGSWCPVCGKISIAKASANRKLGISAMQLLASKRGGECLSPEYHDARFKLTWKCEYGHVWDATPDGIKQGKWCPKCGKEKVLKAVQQKKLTITQMQILAQNKNGECLSTEYTNNSTKLRWRCEFGHEWAATPFHIKGGRWCPKCANAKRWVTRRKII